MIARKVVGMRQASSSLIIPPLLKPHVKKLNKSPALREWQRDALGFTQLEWRDEDNKARTAAKNGRELIDCEL